MLFGKRPFDASNKVKMQVTSVRFISKNDILIFLVHVDSKL